MSDGDIRTRAGLWFRGPYDLRFHCAFMAGKTIMLPTNIVVFGEYSNSWSRLSLGRKYIPESDNSDEMVPVTLTG